jgi:hypothetical protein
MFSVAGNIKSNEAEQFDSYRNNSYSWGEMPWATRQFSKAEIDRAGESLITLFPGDPARDNALIVINNWRSCHSFPLQVIKMTLLKRARSIDAEALIAQRLKRLPSIALKLEQDPSMRLSQMQDIGGCRAVLRDTHQVDKLVKLYESRDRRYEPVRSGKKDYIVQPKEDGYRGVHLIYQYKSTKKAEFNGQRIEIQIRSRLQHIWATAVETAQTFTGQGLKSRVKSAHKAWLRFFTLMGSAMATREKKPRVPGTPDDSQERARELREIAKQEKIIECLVAWNDTIHHLEVAPEARGARAFLLVLKPAELFLEITQFTKNQRMEAQEGYQRAEKENENDKQVQVVLVSVDSLDALRRAYPNYYADTTEFIEAVKREIK